MSFWVRERLEQTVVAFVDEARDKESLHPGTAAKLYGTVNFLESGVFGKVGRSGLNAIKERQYAGGSQLTAEITRALDTIEAVVKSRPCRVVCLTPPTTRRFVGASDAAYEGGIGSGGFLLALNNNPSWSRRLGRVVQIEEGLFRMWHPSKTYIAQLELLMVLVALLQLARLEYPEALGALVAVLVRVHRQQHRHRRAVEVQAMETRDDALPLGAPAACWASGEQKPQWIVDVLELLGDECNDTQMLGGKLFAF